MIWLIPTALLIWQAYFPVRLMITGRADRKRYKAAREADELWDAQLAARRLERAQRATGEWAL